MGCEMSHRWPCGVTAPYHPGVGTTIWAEKLCRTCRVKHTVEKVVDQKWYDAVDRANTRELKARGL